MTYPAGLPTKHFFNTPHEKNANRGHNFTSYQYHCVQVSFVAVSVCLNTSLVATYFFHLLCKLHTVAGPAVQAAVKTVLSYQNDMIIAIFSANSKNKDKAKVALAS